MFILAVITLLFVAIFHLAGYRAYIVSSESMKNVFNTGDVIITRKTDIDLLQKDDIITFRRTNTNIIITHRITEIDDETGFIYTKGDANETSDADPVLPANVFGVYKGKITFFKFIFK